MFRMFLLRFSLFTLFGIIVAIGINEFSFQFLKSGAGRGPEQIELNIPAGTADKVASGSTVQSIPSDMIFVAGDILVIHNQDNVDHKLGSLLIPAGSSASLALDDAQKFAYLCSFQPSKVFGIDVQEPVTSATRVYGVMIAGIPLGVMLAMYSLIVWPINKKEKASENE
jgi:hypothetical protein